METITLNKDLKVFYVTAASFPENIMDAHNELHRLVPFSRDRNYFGISRPENGTIIYRAATEEKYPGEAEKFKCDSITLKKGKYITTSVTNFRTDPLSIQNAFQKLLSDSKIDPQGYCVEWYSNDKEEVKCMVRLKD